MPKKYSDVQVTEAVMQMVNEGWTVIEAEKHTGIPRRTIYRMKERIMNPEGEIIAPPNSIAIAETSALNQKISSQIDEAAATQIRVQAKLLTLKELLIDTLIKKTPGQFNIDYLQKTLKTVVELDNKKSPGEPVIPAEVNIFNFYADKFKKKGYEGPVLTDADIVEGD